MNYHEAVKYLQSFNDLERGIQASGNPMMSLASVQTLLGRLGDPQLGRTTVHITGSKGKGSVAAMVEGVLRHAELRTAMYTSPHLHSYTERIAIDGDAISPMEFGTGLEAIQAAVEAEQEAAGGSVSTFGVLTALFFWMTRAQAPHVDVQVVEVGLGGTYDATNVFKHPEVVVITPVSMEHAAILGDTPAEIARDKSGLVKAGTICVLAKQEDKTVRGVVEEQCYRVGATLVDVGEEYETEVIERHVFGQAFHVRTGGETLELRTPMLGRHQVENAATAVAVAAALRAKGTVIPTRAVTDGIARTRVRGRAEVMAQAPVVLADGAHNEASAAALVATIEEYLEWKKVHFVMAATHDKDLRGIAHRLGRIASSVVCTRINSPRSAEPETIRSAFEGLAVETSVADSVEAGLAAALEAAGEEDAVCVTGSLYAVAEARDHVLGELVTHPDDGEGRGT